MRKQWTVRPVDEQAVERLAQELDATPLIARVLMNRGVTSVDEAAHFLCADLGGLADPFRMAGMREAVELLRRAAERRERVLIVGDYDADGLTGSAILLRVLRVLGAQAECHIPHRLEEGYGLRQPVVEKAHRSGASLLITVDCGTTSFGEVESARRLGMEVIVVDHHDLDPARTPAASALLNPLRTDCGYPEKELASVGVAFTLARGLAGARGASSAVWEHLDLVTLGTVADAAPLTGENRILVRAGLHALSGTRKAGLRALLSAVGLDGETLSPEEVSFMLAPPLNAAGRLGSAETTLRLLTTDDAQEAQETARLLLRDNRARSTLEREAYRRALAKVSREINFNQDRVIVLHDDQWHLGVVGILASRLAHRFHRPTVVIGANGDVCRGSARSIRSFNLVEALHGTREHLVEFGGHPGAAGLTIERERVAPFRDALNRFASERLGREALAPTVELDGELPLTDLTDSFLRDLEALAPFGIGNTRPVFLSRDARLSAEPPAAGSFSRIGVRLVVQGSRGESFEAVHPREALGGAWNVRRLRGNVHLAYSPLRKRQEGRTAIELRLRDLRLP